MTHARQRVVPVRCREARVFCARHHSHHRPPTGGLFAVGVAVGPELVAVAIIGRPVARLLAADPACCEVTRVATDRTPHAASMVVAAARRAALALGYLRIVTYTLLGEAGTTYRATGWSVAALTRAEGWSRPSRARAAPDQPGAKVRWETGPEARHDPEAEAAMLAAVGKVALPARRVDVGPLFARAGR